MAAKFCEAPGGLREGTLCFFGLSEGVQTYADLVGVLALLLAALTIAYNLIQAWNAFLLIRRMNPAAKRGSAIASIFTIVEIALRHPLSLFQLSLNLFARMRMRVEHELFDPRPEWEWPLGEDRDESMIDQRVSILTALAGAIIAGAAMALATAALPAPSCGALWAGLAIGVLLLVLALSKRAYLSASWRFAGERLAWHYRMAWIATDQTIAVGTAGDINDEFEAISRYFEVIKTMPFVDRDELSFLCPVEVKRGFVAPLHLLTGLIAQYNDKWDGIINEFETQTGYWDEIPLIDGDDGSGRMMARDFRQLQSFIYHCWLLWGPSIPICKPSCGHWAGGYLSIQYGFGDENNSIEIVGRRNLLTEAVNAMLSDYSPGFGGMAFPASVRGILQYSTTAQRGDGNIPRLIGASWGGSQDARPILFFSEFQPGDASIARRGREIVVGQINPEVREPGAPLAISRYYSAYLWIMFVVLEKVGTEWRPLQADPAVNPKRAPLPWKSTIPFFEHGNIADAESCAFGKQALADKVLGALTQFAAHWAPNTYPLRFAYSGAIDDGNCGQGLEFEALAGGALVKDLIAARLANLPEGSVLQRLTDEQIIDFTYFNAAPNHHPHSACALPEHISDYYDTFGGQSASADRKSDGDAPSSASASATDVNAARSGAGSNSATSPPA